MCAIIGWKGQITRGLLRDLFRGSAPFGPDAVGLAYFDECGSNFFKRAVSPSYFLRNCNHRLNRAVRFQTGFGHVRKASHGMPHGDAVAHPFVYAGIVYAHNGTLAPMWKLLSHSTIPWARTDSEALGPFIQEKRPAFLPGPKGLIWMHAGQLYAYRLNQRLNAITIGWTNSGHTTTIVVTHVESLLTAKDVVLGRAEVLNHHFLEEGVAYKIHEKGPEKAWTDANVIRSWTTSTTSQDSIPMALPS